MRLDMANSSDETAQEETRGMFARVLARVRALRLRGVPRSPYIVPAMVFGRGRFLALAVFAFGMAYVEAACVVYLWEKLYPEGFQFPLLLVVEERYEPLVAMEMGRELATMVMLVGFAVAAGRTKVQRVASLLFVFGTWDIFYYFWLRVMTALTHFSAFPASLATWDILFLVPVPWTGPVYAPVVVAATMTLFAVLLVFAERRGVRIKPDLRFWIIEATAALMLFGSFVWNCGKVLAKQVPSSYPWWLLLPGEIIAVTAFLYLIRECLYREA